MPGLERAVRGGAAAAGVGVVDEVVVDERGGVEHLERRGCRDDRLAERRRQGADASSTALHPATQNRPRSRFPPVAASAAARRRTAPPRRRHPSRPRAEPR